MSAKYSITCSAMGDHDVALIKSLLTIVGKVGGVEWVWSDAPADVVIVDAEHTPPAQLQELHPRAVIAYAAATQDLVPDAISLHKPARARDFMGVLASVKERLASA